MADKVFYSWQSDSPNSTNRGFIEDVLERVLKNLGQSQDELYEPQREVRRRQIPARALAFADPDVAGGRAHGEQVAVLRDVEAVAVHQVEARALGQALVKVLTDLPPPVVRVTTGRCPVKSTKWTFQPIQPIISFSIS